MGFISVDVVAAEFLAVKKMLEEVGGRLIEGDLGGVSCHLNVFLLLSHRYGRENERRFMGERESFLQGTNARFKPRFS